MQVTGEVADGIVRDTTEILASGERIAIGLIGIQALRHAYELGQIRESAIEGLSRDEWYEYRDGRKQSDQITDYEQIIDLVFASALIASANVEDVQGFTLQGIVRNEALDTSAFYLICEGATDEDPDMTSRAIRILPTTPRPLLTQSNGFAKKNIGSLLFHALNSKEDDTPELNPEEIATYLTRYALYLKMMEDMPTDELLEEIKPWLKLGWEPSGSSY